MTNRNRLRGRRPSPALVVSIIALIMSMAGTATAARVLIKSSSQIKAGAVNSGDIRDNSVRGRDIRDGTVSTGDFEASTRSLIEQSGTQAIEAFRKSGPEDQAADKSARVATLSNIPPGTYAIFAKTILTPKENTGRLFDTGGSVGGHCVLDAGGDRDDARTILGAPGALSPGSLNLQITRAYGDTGTATLDCQVSEAPWRASDTSIIAIRVGRAPRTPVEG